MTHRPPLGQIALITTALLLSGFINTGLAGGEVGPHLFSTGSTLEIDRCASAWLIKRFVDPEAVFKFYPDGALIEEGVAFDTPDAQLARTHNQSTFEVIADTYAITDAGVAKLGAIIHDVEINFWSGYKIQQSQAVVQAVDRIIASSADKHQCLKRCFEYFDRMIAEFK